MPFRFAAKYGLLTYSALGEDSSAVGELAWKIVRTLGERGAECIVGREHHRDGGLHLHAFFMFGRKFESRDVRVFDVDGHHPNIVRGYSSPRAGYDYAIKEGDVVAGGLEQPDDRRGATMDRDGGVWAEILLAETREEFFETCARLAPRALLCSFTSLSCYADWKYRPIPEPYRSPEGLQFVTDGFPELAQFVERMHGGCRGGERFFTDSLPGFGWAGALPVARGDVGAPFGFPRHRTSPPCQVWINADLLQNEHEASSSGEELDWVKPYGPGR